MVEKANTVDHLLISFCNPTPAGLALGRYCFDTNEFEWINPEVDSMSLIGATGICHHRGCYYVLFQMGLSRTALAVLDSEFRITGCSPLEQVSDGHSLTATDDGLFVISTGLDQVIRVMWDGNAAREGIFWAATPSGSDTVHVNSIGLFEGRPFISCFGPKQGVNWSETRNGAVVDVTTGEQVCGELLHPHSLFLLNERLHVLDSRAGAVLEIDMSSKQARARWRVPGYLRGAAVRGRFLYVGASAYRQRSKSTRVVRHAPEGSEKRCMVHRIDTITGEIESRDLTPFGLEIYDLAITVEAPFRCRREEAMQIRLRRYDEAMLGNLTALEETARCQLAYDTVLRRLINEDQNFLAASVALERLLALYPSNPDWQYHYGICLLNLGAAERSVAYLENALDSGYDEFWIRFHLASAYLACRKLDAAQKELKRAEALKPESAQIVTLAEWIADAERAARANPRETQKRCATIIGSSNHDLAVT